MLKYYFEYLIDYVSEVRRPWDMNDYCKGHNEMLIRDTMSTKTEQLLHLVNSRVPSSTVLMSYQLSYGMSRSAVLYWAVLRARAVVNADFGLHMDPPTNLWLWLAWFYNNIQNFIYKIL